MHLSNPSISRVAGDAGFCAGCSAIDRARLIVGLRVEQDRPCGRRRVRQPGRHKLYRYDTRRSLLFRLLPLPPVISSADTCELLGYVHDRGAGPDLRCYNRAPHNMVPIPTSQVSIP